MDDWRNKPRIGKSQVMPWLQQIEARLDMGATMKQVYDELTAQESMSLGYRQFVRYIHMLVSSEKTRSPGTGSSQAAMSPPPAPSDVAAVNQSVPLPQPEASSQKPPLTRAEVRQMNNDVRNLDFDALVKGKGLVATKS